MEQALVNKGNLTLLIHVLASTTPASIKEICGSCANGVAGKEKHPVEKFKKFFNLIAEGASSEKREAELKKLKLKIGN